MSDTATLDDRLNAYEDELADLLAPAGTPVPAVRAGHFDNRHAWDKLPAKPWDNRSSWDNWKNK
jgi:hypothetical protein